MWDIQFFVPGCFLWVTGQFRKPFENEARIKLETQVFDRMDVIMKLKDIFTKKMCRGCQWLPQYFCGLRMI